MYLPLTPPDSFPFVYPKAALCRHSSLAPLPLLSPVSRQLDPLPVEGFLTWNTVSLCLPPAFLTMKDPCPFLFWDENYKPFMLSPKQARVAAVLGRYPGPSLPPPTSWLRPLCYNTLLISLLLILHTSVRDGTCNACMLFLLLSAFIAYFKKSAHYCIDT